MIAIAGVTWVLLPLAREAARFLRGCRGRSEMRTMNKVETEGSWVYTYNN
jgi:hypothetical protein